MEFAADRKQIPRYFPTSTPILDGLHPLPARKPLRLIAGEYFFLSGALILAIIGWPAFRSLSESLSGRGVVFALLIVCVLIPAAALAASLVVHEAGHWIAARLAGFRLMPRMVSSDGGGSDLGLRMDCRGLLRIGAWTMESPRLDRLHRRLFLAMLGGPLASVLAPVLLAELATAARLGPLVVFSMQVFGAMSLLLGIAESLPDIGRGNASDGARLLMLLRNDALAERWLSLIGLQPARDRNVPLRAWDEATVIGAMVLADDSRDAVTARWVGYLWATGRQDITSAAKYLEEALAAPASSSDWLRDRLFLEAAVFQAWFREDLDKAEMWAQRIRRRKLTPDQRARLHIAELWAQGRLFDAWEKLSRLLEHWQQGPSPSPAGFAQTNCLEWKRQMESRMLTRAWRAMYSTTQAVDGSMPENANLEATEPASLSS